MPFSFASLFTTHILLWSLTAAVIVHIFEEFVFPGGFKAWYQAYRPQTAASVSDRFLVIINAVLLVLCIGVALIGATPTGVSAWLTLAAALFSNAVFHLVAAWQTRRYSPGMGSGLLIYVPLTVFGFFHFVHTGQASSGTALAAFVIGGSYQWLSSAGHHLRARKIERNAED